MLKEPMFASEGIEPIRMCRYTVAAVALPPKQRAALLKVAEMKHKRLFSHKQKQKVKRPRYDQVFDSSHPIGPAKEMKQWST